MSKTFLVEVSARHVHLDRKTIDVLFGEGYELTEIRDLSQPGQFVCEERVTVKGPKREIENVVILGPLRPQTQVEVSLTDCYAIGSVAPLRESGDTHNSTPVTLKGPKGEVEIKEGLIVAKRHIHMTQEDADNLGVEDKQIVSVEVDTARPVIFKDVVVRVKDSFALAMHVDTDEANAAMIGRAGCEGKIVDA